MLKRLWTNVREFIIWLNDRFENDDPYSKQAINKYVENAKDKYM